MFVLLRSLKQYIRRFVCSERNGIKASNRTSKENWRWVVW